tara:strand:+ start:311 stop:793 length:483 start_codon:yes stop_codon:yes gene_type:complete
MKKYGDHITNKYDKYFEHHIYDEVLKERHWTGDIQKLKNYCFNNNDDGAWNDPETFDAHFSAMVELIGGKVYWNERYEKNPLEFQGYGVETIHSIGIGETSYEDKEPVFFLNKDGSRWCNLDYALEHLIERPKKESDEDRRDRIKQDNANIQRVDSQIKR